MGELSKGVQSGLYYELVSFRAVSGDTCSSHFFHHHKWLSLHTHSLRQCPQSAGRLHCRHHWIGMSLHNMVAYCIPISNPGNHQFSSLRFQSLTPLGEPSQAWAQFFQAWHLAFSTLIPVPRLFWVETLLGCSVSFCLLIIFFPLSMPLSLKGFYLTSPLSSLLGPPLPWSHPKSFPPQNSKRFSPDEFLVMNHACLMTYSNNHFMVRVIPTSLSLAGQISVCR